MIVLDTNVVSELMRARPNPAVAAWVRGRTTTELFSTAVTVAEIRFGIRRLPSGRRRDELTAAAEQVLSGIAEFVLPFDGRAALEFADVLSTRERLGAPMSGFDGQIAAICRTQHAALATRDTKDFAGVGLSLIDPWVDPA